MEEPLPITIRLESGGILQIGPDPDPGMHTQIRTVVDRSQNAISATMRLHRDEVQALVEALRSELRVR